VVKQISQTEEQAGVAYANLLLTEQGQELITQTGFVQIRWLLLLMASTLANTKPIRFQSGF